MKMIFLKKLMSCLLLALCLATMGCGSSEGRNLPLDMDLARDACKDFLEAWKSGDKAADLAPAIIGKDEAWDAGEKLTDFEFLPNESDGGSNLHIPVRLTVKSPQGRESKLEVTYIVGTYPKVTVFRD